MQELPVWSSVQVLHFRLFRDLSMYKRPKNVLAKRNHSPTPKECKLERMQYRSWNGKRNSFVNTDIHRPNVEIPPVRVHVRIDVFTSLFVVLQYAVSNLLKYSILGRNDCYESFYEELREVDFLDFQIRGVGLSFDERVEFTSEFGVDWKVTHPVIPDGVSVDAFLVLILMKLE